MRRLAFWTLFLLIVVSFAAGMAGGSTMPRRTYWKAGVAAILPANAVTGTTQTASLNSISCASAGNCSAVGSYLTKAGAVEGLLVSETRGRWARGLEAVLPANAATGDDQSVSVNSVSCPSAGNCSAVGSYFDGSGSEGLLVTETSGKWRTGVEAALPAAPAVKDEHAGLSSVSCTSNGNCSAVGGYAYGSGSRALVLTESAGSWKTGIEPALPADASPTEPDASLGSVSCPSPGNCSAIGGYTDTSGNGPGLLLTETAGKWGAGVEAALPANAAATQQFVAMYSVSCASAGNCTAVGNYNTHVSDDAVLLTEKSGAWAQGVKAVLPTNAAAPDQVNLYALSCPSTGDCVAVGEYVDRGGNIRGVLLSRTAGDWSNGVEAPLPANALTSPPNQLGGLSAVSCASPDNCTAVGSYTDKAGDPDGLFVTETEGRWATGVEAVDGPSVSYDAGLTTVSCSSARLCGAAGGNQLPQAVLFSSSTTPPCLVPELKGKTLAAARRSIKAGHCAVGKIKRAPSRKVKGGRVISQNPRPGRSLNHGAKVSLVVSTGKS